MLPGWRHCPQPWSSFNCTSLSFIETSVQLQASAMMDVGTSPSIHTECLNSNRGKEKLRTWPEMGESLHKRRKLEHNAKWMEFQGEETGGYCCVDIQPRKETVLCLPLTVEVYAVPSQLGGQWGLPCPPGRTDSEWPVNTASANNLRALLTGKEAGCPAGPNWECWGAASPKDTSVTWICDFHHSNCWCWRQNDSRGKKRSSQEGILGFYKEERETTEDEMLG